MDKFSPDKPLPVDHDYFQPADMRNRRERRAAERREIREQAAEIKRLRTQLAQASSRAGGEEG